MAKHSWHEESIGVPLINDLMEKHNKVEDLQDDNERSMMKAQLDEWFARYADPAVDGSREPVTGAG